MAILSVNFIVLSALVNNTFFINRPPGVTKAYMYLYPDVEENNGHWIELQKNIQYGGVAVFQANISDYIVTRKCNVETISYMLRLVYHNDIKNYGDTPDVNKILIPKKRMCTSTTTAAVETSLVTEQFTPTTKMYSNFTEKFPQTTTEMDYLVNCSMQFPSNFTYNSSSPEIFSCTLTNLLLFSISFNSCFVGIVYIIIKLIVYFYYKLKL